MINLDIKISAEKVIVALIFKINSGGIQIIMAFINQNTILLFWIVILMFEIWCLAITIFFLVSYFIDIITREQYSWIFYHKFWQLY